MKGSDYAVFVMSVYVALAACAPTTRADDPKGWKTGDEMPRAESTFGGSRTPDGTGSVALALPALNTFMITDGACSFSLTNVVGHRTGGSAGLADLVVQSLEHVFQNWFWYRSTGDTREYALANQIAADVSGNRARLLYSEPVSDGAVPDALLIDLEYTLTDLGADQGAEPPACRRCALAIAVTVRNRAGEPTDVEFFSYNDMDLANNSGGDVGVIGGSANQAQLLFDPPSLLDAVGAVYKVSSSGNTGWEMGAYPTIRTRLDDAAVNDLANTGSPFGPADYTGAEQWSFQLASAGSVVPQDTWLGSVTVDLTIFRDGDVDGDCNVDLFDHYLMLQNFSGPMP